MISRYSKEKLSLIVRKNIKKFRLMRKYILQELADLTGLTHGYVRDLEWFNKLKKYKKVESITRNILDSLIEKILIYEDGNIKIIFNFQNEYDELIRYLNSHDFVV